MNETTNVLSLTKSLLLGIVLRDRIAIMGHFTDLEATFPIVKMLLSRDICSRCCAKYFSSATVKLIDWRASQIDLCVLSASTTTTSSSSGSSISGSNSNTISSSSGSSGIGIYMSRNCCP
ncbi:sericin-2 [Trichinella spiralis]|uniref:sericin-2 n=1 Tax=Trichinella spiralis TaxID=6334 RepID=UPI0001EFBB47|nr:sericin-2 [Trichinella spiralis]